MVGDQTDEAVRLRGEIREYILDMLSQLAAMAEACRDRAIAETLRKVVADASSDMCATG